MGSALQLLYRLSGKYRLMGTEIIAFFICDHAQT